MSKIIEILTVKVRINSSESFVNLIKFISSQKEENGFTVH